MSPIHADVDAYETWLAKECQDFEPEALKSKHSKMSADPGQFLRATYFRWARTILHWLPELRQAPAVLGVGDIHVENFGAWRDDEGRLVWGVNDFDEAATIPACLDLVRLATSVRLAALDQSTSPEEAAAAILRGYHRGLDAPRPIVLHEKHVRLRKAVTCSDKDRRAFWSEIRALEPTEPPWRAKAGLRYALPKGSTDLTYHRREAGVGSLGRARYVVIATWRGGRMVREAKAVVPSAWGWANGGALSKSEFMTAAAGPHRCPDPFLKAENHYVFRRLAPDSRKIEMPQKAIRTLDDHLLELMGAELAAIHSARPNAAAAIQADLRTRDDDWLEAAAAVMHRAVDDDYAAWCEIHPRRP